MAFYVGQKVVCVHRKGSAYSMKNRPHDAILPDVGSVYTIRAIHDYPQASLLHLAEIDNSHLACSLIEPGFNSAGFRPVIERKTDISIFTEMLKPKQRELSH